MTTPHATILDILTAQQQRQAARLDTIHHCDALTLMRALPEASVDLIVTDPPYFKFKPLWWDWQWDTRNSFLCWIYELTLEWQRVLKPNGSLYVFASPQMTARVECEIGKLFNILNSLVWYKTTGNRNWSSDKAATRAFLPNTERIIFAEHFNSDAYASGESNYTSAVDDLRGFVFEPIRAYLDSERVKAGVSFEDVRQIVECAPGSGLPSHWFTKSQWALPTEENYHKLQAGFNNCEYKFLRREYEDLRREYKFLRREYEDLRREYEDLRRPFNISEKVQFSDVWFFAPVQSYEGKHPAEKPLSLLQHIIRASGQPGKIILDPFCGSGSTLDAARRLGLHYIGCDLDPHWAEYARERLSQPYTIPMDFETKDYIPQLSQKSMFEE